MRSELKLVLKDFELQAKIMEFLAKAYDAFNGWRTGHWIFAAADLHRILLRRNQLIGDCLSKLRDLSGKTEAPRNLAPLNLHDEEKSFLSAIKLIDENARAEAYEYLQRLRATNVRWRTKNLQLMLSHSWELPRDVWIDARLAFQRITLYDMLKLDPGAQAHLCHPEPGPLWGGLSDENLAKDFDAPEAFLNEEREEKLLSIFVPQEKAIMVGGTRGGVHRPEEAPGDLISRGETALPVDEPGSRGLLAKKPLEEIVPVRRTPHMDVNTDVPIQPGTEFQVYVFADQEQARPGESKEDIVLLAPYEIKEFYLDVWLFTTEHFEVVQKPLDKLRIHREEAASNRLAFTVRTRTVDELNALQDKLPTLHKGSITACFLSHDGDPCGRVGRVVELAIATPATLKLVEGKANRAMVPEPKHSIEVRIADKKPDMTVQVMQDEEINDGRHFHCLVVTCMEKTSWSWTTSAPTSEIVGSYMSNFTATDKSQEQLKAALRGAGIELFKASPKNFKEAFWRLVDNGLAPNTIQVITDEPHFLWELMVPTRGPERRPALGIEFTIGRWVNGDATSPSLQIPITDSYVIAPSYQGGKKLKLAEAESKMVCDKFSGKPIQPATFDSIISQLNARGVSLLHFACHGKAVGISDQVIELDEDTEMTPDELLGADVFESYFRSKQPLVFLNACEVGRQRAALTGAGGFPAVMIGLGARAVIAPAWSVKDTIAHEIATRFYSELEANPGKSLAAIFQEIRKDAYDKGEDTYAAYCFFGSPLATRQ
jgi:hypothetical protein